MLGVQGMLHDEHAKRSISQSNASPLELVSFRFFMIRKEIHNMANTFKHVVIRVFGQEDAYPLRDLRKMAHVQLYLPCSNGSLAHQPFILIQHFKINGCWKCVIDCCKTTLGKSTPHLKQINEGCYYLQLLLQMS